MAAMSHRVRPQLELVAPVAARRAASATSAFDELYARHAGYVAGLAGRILGRDDEVADVVQDVFVVAYRRLSDVRNPEAARAWLGTIAVREAARKLRWRRVRRVLGLARDASEEIIVDPKAAPDLRPLAALLYVALDRLPRHERIAWVLRHLMDEPLDSVAEICGCSLATAKRRIAAAERVLRPIVGADAAEEEEEKR
jgi:RNA polymerase sigma-70 factor (ECF subfamily)